jgi:hypothetical protein
MPSVPHEVAFGVERLLPGEGFPLAYDFRGIAAPDHSGRCTFGDDRHSDSGENYGSNSDPCSPLNIHGGMAHILTICDLLGVMEHVILKQDIYERRNSRAVFDRYAALAVDKTTSANIYVST